MNSNALIIILILLTVAFILATAPAYANVMFAHVDCDTNSACWSGSENNVLDIEDVLFSLMILGGPTMQYKFEVGPVGELGTFSMSYDTAFYNTPIEREYATIRYLGGDAPIIDCPECYLPIKDGKHNPAFGI